MKKSILAIAAISALATTPAFADNSIMFEVGFGFGKSGSRTDGNDNAKFCKNRNTGGMTYMAVRLRDDDVELHGARMLHDEDIANCDRDMWAVGLGYVIDTQGEGDAGYDDQYASWTPGFAYTWGENNNFTGQDSDNTNWRQTGNWQTFNRFAVGATTEDNYAVEVAVNRYGSFNPEHGEYFVTVGAMLRDLDNPNANGGNGGDTYNTYNTYNTTNITIVDGNDGTDLGPDAPTRPQ